MIIVRKEEMCEKGKRNGKIFKEGSEDGNTTTDSSKWPLTYDYTE